MLLMRRSRSVKVEKVHDKRPDGREELRKRRQQNDGKLHKGRTSPSTLGGDFAPLAHLPITYVYKCIHNILYSYKYLV